MNQIRKLLASLTLRQQVSIVLTIVAVGVGLWTFAKWNRERDFRPLYANLAAEDAGAVMQKLKEEGVEYRVDDSGTTLRVPSDKVAELRLQMASAGLPKTGRIGFELFDKNSFGLTEFAEQVNYRRAIEGELERSIRALAEIERARVHISLPKDSVFLESKQEGQGQRRGQPARRGEALAPERRRDHLPGRQRRRPAVSGRGDRARLARQSSGPSAQGVGRGRRRSGRRSTWNIARRWSATWCSRSA